MQTTLLARPHTINFPPPHFIKKQRAKIRHSKIADLKVNGIAKISTAVTNQGIKIFINNRSFKLEYPNSIWRRFPTSQKKIFADNVAYSLTFHLPFIFPTLKKLDYALPVPLSETFVYKCFTQSLPATAIMQGERFGKKTSNLLRRFFFTEYNFHHKKTPMPSFNRVSHPGDIVMPFSFGKDSLLTFSLLRDFGITPMPIFIAEPYLPYDVQNKKRLAASFQKEFKIKINFLKNSLGVLRDPSPFGWYGWEIQLTQYSLLMLPYVYATASAYILFSNEQSCNSWLLDQDGFRFNPVYEQSHQWLFQNSFLTSLIGGNSLSIGTLIEPLHELAILKILHHRYPAVGKYQSSCDLEIKPKPGMRWCEACSKCGRIYIMLLANGIDPKTVGFSRNLLRESKKNLYPIFSKKTAVNGYDTSEVGLKEQLFSFLLAYKRGIKGKLIDLFKKNYLKQVAPKEKEWRKIYYGVHTTGTVPRQFLKRILKIYHEELDSLSL